MSMNTDVNAPCRKYIQICIDKFLDVISTNRYKDDLKEIVKNTTMGNRFIFANLVCDYYINKSGLDVKEAIGYANVLGRELVKPNLYKECEEKIKKKNKDDYTSFEDRIELYKELSKLFKYARKGKYINGNFKIDDPDFDKNDTRYRKGDIYPTQKNLRIFELLMTPIILILKKNDFSNFLNLLIDCNSIIYSKEEINKNQKEYHEKFNINTFIDNLVKNEILSNPDDNGIYRDINIEKFEGAFKYFCKNAYDEKNKANITVINKINNICSNNSNSNSNKMNDSIPQLNENATRLFKKILDNNSNDFNINRLNFKEIKNTAKNILVSDEGLQSYRIYEICYPNSENKFYIEFDNSYSAFYIGTNEAGNKSYNSYEKPPILNKRLFPECYGYGLNSADCKGFIIVDSNIKQKYNNKEVIYVGGANYYMNYKKTWGNKNDFFDIIDSDKAHVGCYSSDYENRFYEHLDIVTGNSKNESKKEESIENIKKNSNNVKKSNIINQEITSITVKNLLQNPINNGKLKLAKIDKNKKNNEKDNLSEKENNINSNNIKTIKVKTKKELKNSKKDNIDSISEITQNVVNNIFDSGIENQKNRLNLINNNEEDKKSNSINEDSIKKESHSNKSNNDENNNEFSYRNIVRTDIKNSYNKENQVNYHYNDEQFSKNSINVNMYDNKFNNKTENNGIDIENFNLEPLEDNVDNNININNISKNGEELQKTNEQNTKLDDRNNNEDKFEPIQHTTISKRTDINKNNNKSSTFINSKFLHNENIQHNNDKSETNNDIKEINKDKDNNEIPKFLEGFNDNIQHNNDKSETNNDIKEINKDKDNNEIPEFLEGFNDNIQHNNDKNETNNNIQNNPSNRQNSDYTIGI